MPPLALGRQSLVTAMQPPIIRWECTATHEPFMMEKQEGKTHNPYIMLLTSLPLPPPLSPGRDVPALDEECGQHSHPRQPADTRRGQQAHAGEDGQAQEGHQLHGNHKPVVGVDSLASIAPVEACFRNTRAAAERRGRQGGCAQKGSGAPRAAGGQNSTNNRTRTANAHKRQTTAEIGLLCGGLVAKHLANAGLEVALALQACAKEKRAAAAPA